MRTALIIFALVLGCQCITDDEVLQQWNQFKIDFGKTYKSSVETRKRLSIFRENLKEIEAHNALYENGDETYQKGITQFADWTPEEFMQYVNKFEIPLIKADDVFEFNENLSIPDEKDWRLEGAVREVKNQKSCGSCWSFSATGALEGAAYISKSQVVSLSEQNLIDCATVNYYSHGCNGGSIVGAFMYVMERGITNESEYPYKGVQGRCKSTTPVLKATSYSYVSPSQDAIQQAVATVGPISVGIDATKHLQHYKSGVLYDKTCGSSPNHGVLVVGYGNEKGQNYWLIKNSWGASWGEHGYFKLSRNSDRPCAITSMPLYPYLLDYPDSHSLSTEIQPWSSFFCIHIFLVIIHILKN